MDLVDELTRDGFAAVIQLRRMTASRGAAAFASIDPQVLHHRLCGYIDALIQRGRERGLSPDDLGDVVYALVALADEVALSVAGAVPQFWMSNLLQLRYFNENLAGENFYLRLETLRADP